METIARAIASSSRTNMHEDERGSGVRSSLINLFWYPDFDRVTGFKSVGAYGDCLPKVDKVRFELAGNYPNDDLSCESESSIFQAVFDC